MFRLFKKNLDLNIYSPVCGKCIDITNVKDITFSSKMMGDGVAIIPSNNKITAPFDGEIIMMFPTKHAFGIRRSDGIEVLVHIGIDTVNSNGKGFVSYVNTHDKVKKGDLIILFDENQMDDKYDMTTMLILTKGNIESFDKINLEKEVLSEECLLESR